MKYTTTRSFVRPLALFAAATLVVVGCQSPLIASVSAPRAQVVSAVPVIVDIMASNYAFDAPETLPAGLVTIRMMNHGDEPHHGQLLRLNEGISFDQFAGALQTDGEGALRFATAVGGPGTIDPGRTDQVTLNLQPGVYAMVCFVPGPDGVPHVARGMLKSLRVTGAPSEVAEPEAAGTFTLRDFAFDMPDYLRAGRATYAVTNTGPEIHELSVVMLAPSATDQDLQAWFNAPAGPPPFESVGGINGLSSGESGYVTLNLQPGIYAAVCMVPDPSSGMSHAHLGMIKTFTVA